MNNFLRRPFHFFNSFYICVLILFFYFAFVFLLFIFNTISLLKQLQCCSIVRVLAPKRLF